MSYIKKFNRIKNLGLFKDFKWPPELPEFKQYNLIYGWNGTGKTTFSRLMNSLNAGYCTNFSALEYSALDSDDITFTEKSKYETLIRVFNQDYINEHIDFERQSSDVIHYSIVGSGKIKNEIAKMKLKLRH